MFDLSAFWPRERGGQGRRCVRLFVLRAVLAHSPNSIPPERVFSILNDTFHDDMDSSYADYIELSLQLQFNSRPGGGAMTSERALAPGLCVVGSLLSGTLLVAASQGGQGWAGSCLGDRGRGQWADRHFSRPAIGRRGAGRDIASGIGV